VKRFSDQRIWPQQAHGLWISEVNQQAHGLWISEVNQADLRILKTQWMADQQRILARIPDFACLDVRILGPKQNSDHGSFFSLGR